MTVDLRELPTIATAGEVFSDGSVLELITDPRNPSCPSLLYWHDEQQDVGSRHRLHNAEYISGADRHDILRHVVLPGCPAPYESTETLFDSVCELFQGKAQLDTRSAHLATYYVFLTWLSDCLDIVPLLFISSSDSSHALDVLRLAGSLCRHSLCLEGLDHWRDDFLPLGFDATLILNALDVSHAKNRSELTSQRRDFVHIAKNGAIRRPTAKVVLLDNTGFGKLSDVCAAHIFLAPTDVGTCALQKQDAIDAAAAFQPKFLQYRLKNHARVAGAVSENLVDVPAFTGHVRELARCLRTCVVGSPRLQDYVIELLQSDEALVRSAGWLDLESLVAEALLLICHSSDHSTVHVGRLTEIVNSILGARGENLPITSKKIGTVLRSFGILASRDRSGFRFQLSRDLRRKIHALARNLNVPAWLTHERRCEECA